MSINGAGGSGGVGGGVVLWALQWGVLGDRVPLRKFLVSKEQKRLRESTAVVMRISIYRPSQIACTVTTMHVMCIETALHVHENLCTVLIDAVVSIPYSHSTAFNPQSFTIFLKFPVCLIDLCQSDIQILYGLQKDNGIWQCVNSNRTGIFKNKFVVHGQYSRFSTMLFISIYQKW